MRARSARSDTFGATLLLTTAATHAPSFYMGQLDIFRAAGVPWPCIVAFGVTYTFSRYDVFFYFYFK